MEDTKFIPEIEISDGEDRYGRNIVLRVNRNHNGYGLPNLHKEELKDIADAIYEWLKNN